MGERGRPAHLTLVEKLERQKKRWRHKKARQRKESADSEWLRATNRGYFAEAEVLHWDQLIEYLILVGALDEIDAENSSAHKRRRRDHIGSVQRGGAGTRMAAAPALP